MENNKNSIEYISIFLAIIGMIILSIYFILNSHTQNKNTESFRQSYQNLNQGSYQNPNSIQDNHMNLIQGSHSTRYNQLHNNQLHNNQLHNNQLHNNQLYNNQLHNNQTQDNQLHNNQIQDNQLHNNQTQDNQLHNNQTQDNQLHNQIQDNQLHNNQIQDSQLHNNQLHNNQLHNNQLQDSQNLNYQNPTYLDLDNYKSTLVQNKLQTKGICFFDIDGTLTHAIDDVNEIYLECKKRGFEVGIVTASTRELSDCYGQGWMPTLLSKQFQRDPSLFNSGSIFMGVKQPEVIKYTNLLTPGIYKTLQMMTCRDNLYPHLKDSDIIIFDDDIDVIKDILKINSDINVVCVNLSCGSKNFLNKQIVIDNLNKVLFQ